MPAKAVGNRQERTTGAIIEFLRQEGEAATTSIMEYINNRKRSGLRHGATQGRVCNILAKNPEFVEIGEVYLKGEYYSVKVWRLAEWV